jgi:hypothetical protein
MKGKQMSKIEFIKAANDIALTIVTNANTGAALADRMLEALGNAEKAGLDLNSVWASIASTNEWSDRDAGLEGNPMPKTLANYRSLSRKAMTLGITHQGVKYPEWRKAIAAANKLVIASEEEKAPKIEAIDLNEIALPSWIERANSLRVGMTEENIKAFDKAINHAIESFMQKKVK